MANFPAITPTYDLSKNSAPKVRVAQFGSGYGQRTVYGINQNPKSYLFTWNVSEADADTIEAFLDARGGQESFTFTPPGESAAAQFICKEWRKDIPYLNRATIQALFEQVFEA